MIEVQFHYIVLSSLWTEIYVSLPCFKLVFVHVSMLTPAGAQIDAFIGYQGSEPGNKGHLLISVACVNIL